MLSCATTDSNLNNDFHDFLKMHDASFIRQVTQKSVGVCTGVLVLMDNIHARKKQKAGEAFKAMMSPR